MIYAVWNNKGGTGKTSITFQVVTKFAEIHQESRILVIDACPQANLSELLLGGLTGDGNISLTALHNEPQRRSIGGYFQIRLPLPFSAPEININNFITNPSNFNQKISSNIDLLAGDQILELQSNAISTLSNTLIPGQNTWINVVDWLKDFIVQTNGCYDYVFIDLNPSFSIYTQISLSLAERILIPVMADDSSRRATINVLSLIYGLNIPPASIYSDFLFSSKLLSAGRMLPKIHLLIKNRITQYMGPASAYNSVLMSIDSDINTYLMSFPDIFTFNSLQDGVVEVRDFQTTGVVSFAEGTPFSRLSTGRHYIFGNETQIRPDYLQNCMESIDQIVHKL